MDVLNSIDATHSADDVCLFNFSRPSDCANNVITLLQKVGGTVPRTPKSAGYRYPAYPVEITPMLSRYV